MSRLFLPPSYAKKSGATDSMAETFIREPRLEVHAVKKGPNMGQFALVAHGKNNKGQMAVIELRVVETFLEAACLFDLVRLKIIKPDDVPQFEITEKHLATARDNWLAA